MNKESVILLVGNILRDIRNQSGMTLTELATLAGLDYKTVQRYEIGKHSPDVPSLLAILDVQGVPLAQFAQMLDNARKELDNKPHDTTGQEESR